MRVAFFSAHQFERRFLETANRVPHDLVFLPVRLDRQTVELAAGSDAVCLFVNDDGSAEILERLAELGIRFIALRSAGYNHVDLVRAHELGMRVAYVPEYSPYAVAEHTVALMLALNRKLIRANSRVREMNFSLDGLVGFDMRGRTVGIVGTGRIGRAVARILHGFGCALLGYDPFPNPEVESEFGLQYVDMETLSRLSDIVTLHLPLTPETRYIIGAPMIANMKPGVMLINTSRGGLVDTRAVIQGLKTGRIGYLGLDVYEEEAGLFFEDRSDDILQDDVIARLMTFPNVLITSHQGFLTDTALTNIADTTFAALDAWSAGQRPEHELGAPAELPAEQSPPLPE